MYHVSTGLAKVKSARSGNAARGAAALAEELLAGAAARLAHSPGVVARAGCAERILPPPWRFVVYDAAWLHDIGYADEVARTGFHQLDGARWLAAHGWSMDICRLVAWHSGAETEARLRGLEADLAADFEPPPAMPRDVLTWADLTTSPLGPRWTVERRLADILRRHQPGSVVHQATLAARPGLLETVRMVEALVEDREPDR